MFPIVVLYFKTISKVNFFIITFLGWNLVESENDSNEG